MIPAALIVSVLFFHFPQILGVIQLNDVMTPDQQQKTGIDKLSRAQKNQLETWINDKFVLKPVAAANTAPNTPPAPATPPMPAGPMPPAGLKDLYVSENLDGGAKLQLSNGDTYEVHPSDRDISSAWLLPSNISITPNKDPEYPINLTNTVSKTTVRTRKFNPNQPPATTAPKGGSSNLQKPTK
jgi:hypothetical protein